MPAAVAEGQCLGAPRVRQHSGLVAGCHSRASQAGRGCRRGPPPRDLAHHREITVANGVAMPEVQTHPVEQTLRTQKHATCTCARISTIHTSPGEVLASCQLPTWMCLARRVRTGVALARARQRVAEPSSSWQPSRASTSRICFGDLSRQSVCGCAHVIFSLFPANTHGICHVLCPCRLAHRLSFTKTCPGSSSTC